MKCCAFVKFSGDGSTNVKSDLNLILNCARALWHHLINSEYNCLICWPCEITVKIKSGDWTIISIIEKNFVSYLKNLPLKSFGDAFFNEDFLKEFPNEAQNIEKFKKYLYDHYIIVKNVYEFLQKFGTGAIPTNENSFNTHKESLSKFIKLD